jgi:predicted RND superfamily exporter protein
MSDAAAGGDKPLPRFHRPIGALADWLIRYRVALLIAAAVISAAAVVPAMKLDLDQSVESFFSPSDPLLKNYLASRRAFGGDEFVLVAYPQEHASHAGPLEELAEFSKQLSAVGGVQPGSTQDLARTMRSANAVLSLLPPLPRRAARWAIRERLLEFAKHLLVGENDDVSAVVLRLMPEDGATASRSQTIKDIRALAAAHDPPAYVAGEPVQVQDMFHYVDRDSRVLGLASTALMAMVILIMFRSIRWLVLPLLIVHATLLWTKAILYFSGLQLSMVSSMLTSLLTIIGIATVTHITVLYRDLRATHDRHAAFRRMFIDAAEPVFWVTITTVVGFAALLVSEITPIRSFSWMMSIGTTLLLVTFPMILPAGILLGNFDAEPQVTGMESHVESSLDRLTAVLDRHRIAVLSVTAVISVIAGIGCWMQTVETDFSKNFKSSSPIVQSIRFFETRLGGVGSWEVDFEAPEELTLGYLDKVRKLTSDLRELKLSDGTHLTKVISFTEGLDLIPSMIANDWILKREWLGHMQPEFEQSLYNPGLKRMRIVLRSLEQQPAERKLELIDKVRATAQSAFPGAETTGMYVLLANLITSVLGDQLMSAWVSCAGIILCVWLAFRDWRIALISLAPNVLPILIVVGGIGWAGTPVNIGAAMVASVSLGLTVDASILYLTDYQRARQRGASHDEAVRETHAGAGMALVLASVALMAGFTVLTLSEFIPLVFFGALVSIAMAGGLLGNLVLLPIMLRWLPSPEEGSEARNQGSEKKAAAPALIPDP